ncbi:hypothetical protein MTO96_035925, partial [Rhipicephalus appendiculatus]
MNKAATLTLAVMSVLLFSLYAPLGDATKYLLDFFMQTRIKGRELTCVYTCKHFFHKKEHEHNGTPCWKLFHPGPWAFTNNSRVGPDSDGRCFFRVIRHVEAKEMKSRRFLILALWLSSNVARSSQECRHEYKKLRSTHTACKPANKECTIRKKNVSRAERRLILKAHNDYRSMVATGKLEGFPPAANMLHLLWNEELAAVAQAKAQQCTDGRGTLKHDAPEDRFITRFNKTGQNMAFRRSNVPFNGTDWPAQIKAWFDGYKHYSPSDVNRFWTSPGDSAGHFTQVVWATVRYVGCGYVDYTVAGVAVMPHMQLYVCNYAAAGNVLTLPVYRIGDVCSACPNDTACVKKTGLCMFSA